MSDTKRTSGPWEAALDMDGRHHHVAIMTKAPEFQQEPWPYHPKIAVVYHGYGHANRGTCNATAALIAQAPAMELVINLIRYCNARIDGPEFCFDGMRYSFRGSGPDWNRLLTVIGWDRAEAAVSAAKEKS